MERMESDMPKTKVVGRPTAIEVMGHMAEALAIAAQVLAAADLLDAYIPAKKCRIDELFETVRKEAVLFMKGNANGDGDRVSDGGHVGDGADAATSGDD